MLYTFYRIRASDPYGYYFWDSIYLWPKEDPDAMEYFGPCEEPERAENFQTREEAVEKLEDLKRRLFYFDEYGFEIESFNEEIETRDIAGFITPEGEFIYVPYMQHNAYIWERYHMDKDDFMLQNRWCEITNSATNRGQKTILEPWDDNTHTFVRLTEKQRNKIYEMDMPLEDLSRRQLRFEKEGLL